MACMLASASACIWSKMSSRMQSCTAHLTQVPGYETLLLLYLSCVLHGQCFNSSSCLVARQGRASMWFNRWSVDQSSIVTQGAQHLHTPCQEVVNAKSFNIHSSPQRFTVHHLLRSPPAHDPWTMQIAHKYAQSRLHCS